MHIVYAGQRHDYGSVVRGRAYEEYAFRDTFEAMGHRVTAFDTGGEARRLGRRRASERFAELATRPDVDLVFVFLFEDDLDRDVMRSVTACAAAPTLTWFGDDHWRFDDFSREWAPAFSHVATTVPALLPAYRALGVTPLLTQWAATPSHVPGGRPLAHDVSFVGQAYGTRSRTITALRSAGLDVLVRGYGWGVPTTVGRLLTSGPLAHRGGGYVNERLAARTRCDQAEMVEIFESSRVNVNLTEASQGRSRQIKGRTFEVPASGGFLLTGPASDLEAYLTPDRECVVAEDDDDLVEKAAWWLAHDSAREALTHAGHRRVDNEHRFVHRFAAIFADMGLSG